MTGLGHYWSLPALGLLSMHRQCCGLCPGMRYSMVTAPCQMPMSDYCQKRQGDCWTSTSFPLLTLLPLFQVTAVIALEGKKKKEQKKKKKRLGEKYQEMHSSLVSALTTWGPALRCLVCVCMCVFVCVCVCVGNEWGRQVCMGVRWRSGHGLVLVWSGVSVPIHCQT